MFTADDLGKLILLSYWGPMLLLMAVATLVLMVRRISLSAAALAEADSP